MNLERTPEIAGLLQQPEVAELVSNEESLGPKLEAAAQTLIQQYPDADQALLVSGLQKLARGLREDRLRVFVSYKKSEAAMAQVVLDELRERAGTKMEFSWSEEYPPGEEWRQKISRSIKEANWFLLLLPDPAIDWDWCLYETGLFRASMLPGDRLICLHHPDVPRPDQISDIQTVEANRESLEEFLRFVFLQENSMPGLAPINPHIEKRVPEVAKAICRAINPPAGRRRHFDHFVMIEPPRGDGSLAEALIFESDVETAKLFGLIEVPDTWGELVSHLPSSPSASAQWIEELEQAVNLAAKGEWFDHPQGTFRASRGGKVYRPHLHAMDLMSNNTVKSLQIIFVEDISPLPPEQSGIPRDLASLATSLRLAYRFRWEVIEEFGNRDNLEEQDILALEETLERIEAEAEVRGLMDPTALAGVFDEERSEWITQMYATWWKYRNPEGRGEMDVAMKAGDGAALKGILAALQELNQEYMAMASRRFAEWAAAQHSGTSKRQEPEAAKPDGSAAPPTALEAAPEPVAPREPAAPAVESTVAPPVTEPSTEPPMAPEPAPPSPAVLPVEPAESAVPRKSGLATAALVLGVLSIVPGVGVLALIVGLLALRNLRSHSHKRGKGRAVVGMLLAVAFSVAWLVMLGQ